ncbi:inhibin alpha chain-like [Argiope bruennichi]|uniref:inhibin alpha chain-like n=1 Tax=Argiope bruennichi TaxID=94029 RepID=UPI002495229D|nr:inhibin alpha chain-like [Argiope bruennichi]
MASQARAVFIACVLLFLFYRVRSRPEGSLKLFSPQNSSTESEENELSDIRQKVIENFKSKVLRSLKMPQPPTRNFTNHFLSSKMIELLQEEEKEIARTEPKQNVIVHPSNNDFSCQRGNGTFCRKFDFNITSDLESIISLHAYFHKMQLNERLTLSVYDPDSLEDDPLVKLREDPARAKTNPEWISFELPKKLALEAEDNHLICSVEIEGSDISVNEEESPFLVITKHTEVKDRTRREVEDDSLSENCTCCADNYHITLDDIGWSNWVHYPKSFNIRVCRGQCTENLNYFTINYSRVINSFYKINKTIPKPTCNFWGPRCKAETYSSLAMIYQGNDGTLYNADINDMIIKTCKCM